MASFQWIDSDDRFRLAIRPRPGIRLVTELREWRAAGVDCIISLQSKRESRRLGLAEEPEIAEQLGLTFERFAIADHGVPARSKAALEVADRALRWLQAGQGVVYHCHAGIGRSGTMAILTLILAGFSVKEATARVTQARGRPVPENEQQSAWLRKISANL
ncbi:MAG: protein-tyrosine phosphatase family protein [Myxococcota bacterium]